MTYLVQKTISSVYGVAFCFNFLLNTQMNAASFQGLGDLPGGASESFSAGVSDDGFFVAGTGSGVNGYEAFRWDPINGMVGLGDLPGGGIYSHGAEISNDGNVVGGASRSSNGIEAFRWDAINGMVGLGDLPGGGFLSDVRDINQDGSVLVGIGSSSNGFPEAFRWENGVMMPIGDLSGGPFVSDAHSVSPDGNTIVGGSRSGIGQEGFKWDPINGMIGLGDFPGGPVVSGAVGISGDSSVIVGHGATGDGRIAARWINGTMEPLGDLPGGRVEAVAHNANFDGSIIVGTSHSGNADPYGFGVEAFIWDTTNGLRNLKDVLESEHGLDLSGWILTSAEDISNNGQFITGSGFNPQGKMEAWLVELPTCSCEELSATAFEPPMGKTRKLKSNLPIKFNLFHGNTEVTSQESLDQLLEASGCPEACPEIFVYQAVGTSLIPIDIGSESCFEFGDSKWIYHLRLSSGTFEKGSIYHVEVGIGDYIVIPSNNSFIVR